MVSAKQKKAQFCSLLGTQFPVIQAPMAGVQDSRLALQVMAAGGLGSLPAATLPTEVLGAELKILQQSGRPYNANFFCHLPPKPDSKRELAWLEKLAPYFAELGVPPKSFSGAPGRNPFNDEVVDVVESFRPPIVSFHFGLPPAPLLRRVRKWKPMILASATTVREAMWLEAQGVDAIIAQGLEAGGHRGFFLSKDIQSQLGTFALLPQIANAVRTPVIAAGGIANEHSVAAAMELGASGVQAGTAYLLCTEATTSPLHRAAIENEASSSTAKGTALTNLFTGGAARGIMNRLMREIGPMDDTIPEFPNATASTRPLRLEAERRGLVDFTPLWCGQNGSFCQSVSAQDVTESLISGLPTH